MLSGYLVNSDNSAKKVAKHPSVGGVGNLVP